MTASLTLALLALAQGPNLSGDYRGTLGRPIVMRLSDREGQLAGTYFYEPNIDDLQLQGSVGPDGSFTLDEGPREKPTGRFAGKSQPDGTLQGTWTAAAGGKALPFQLAKVVPDPAGQAPVTLVERRVKINRGKCQLEVSYPELVGAPFTAEAKINAQLRPSAWDGDEKLPAHLGDAREVCRVMGHAFFSETLEIRHNARGLLSALALLEDDFEGAAHPNDGMETWTYVLATGQRLRLGDVLKLGARKSLRRIVRPLIAAQLKKSDDDDDADLAQAVEDELLGRKADFVLEAGGLRLYAVNALPHAIQGGWDAGFLLPWATLRSVLRDDSPAAALWKSPVP